MRSLPNDWLISLPWWIHLTNLNTLLQMHHEFPLRIFLRLASHRFQKTQFLPSDTKMIKQHLLIYLNEFYWKWDSQQCSNMIMTNAWVTEIAFHHQHWCQLDETWNLALPWKFQFTENRNQHFKTLYRGSITKTYGNPKTCLISKNITFDKI